MATEQQEILDQALFVKRGAAFASQNERSLEFARAIAETVIADRVGGQCTIEHGLVDGNNDTGIDVIAFVLNGTLIETMSDLRAAPPSLRDEIELHFFQSTESPQYQRRKVRTFFSGVRDFLADTPTLKRNAAVSSACDVMRELVTTRTNPNIELMLHYMALGSENAAESVEHELRQELGSVINTQLLPNTIPRLQAYARNEIIERIRDASNQNRISVAADHVHPSPDNNANKSFYGLLSREEVLRMVSDPHPKTGERTFKKTVFYENIRGRLSADNEIGTGIRESLRSPQRSNLFHALNHGLTIVCSGATLNDGKLELVNYQIVNGLQTCLAVLHTAPDAPEGPCNINVTIIATTDARVREEIILATNSQNDVKAEDKLSLLPFNRTVALYYQAMQRHDEAPNKLRYRLHRGASDIEDEQKAINVIEPYEQVKCYVAMFREAPHIAAKGFAAVKGQIERGLLSDTAEHASAHYASGLALYRLRKDMNDGIIDSSVNTYRYLVLAGIGQQLKQRFPDLTGTPLAERARTALWSDQSWQELRDRAVAAPQEVLDAINMSNSVKDEQVWLAVQSTLRHTTGH